MSSFRIAELGFKVTQRIDILCQLVDREMKLLYKRSALGVAWTLISPLLQLLIFSFVFQVILPVGIPHYASFTFIGLLSWNWFQSSLFQATGVIISNRSLLRQPGFPPSLLPIIIATTGLVHFLLALPILILFLLLDGIELKPVAVLIPLIQLIQFLLIVTCSYLLAALNVKFRDVQHILGILLQLLFYVTPIFYDIQNVPAHYQFFYNLNPMVHIVKAYREILLEGVFPDWNSLLSLSLILIVCFPIGLQIFRRQSNRFVEEL